MQADSLPAEPQGKSKNTGVDSLSLLQQIFPTQELNRSLLHCLQILYQLSYEGIPQNAKFRLEFVKILSGTLPVSCPDYKYSVRRRTIQRVSLMRFCLSSSFLTSTSVLVHLSWPLPTCHLPLPSSLLYFSMRHSHSCELPALHGGSPTKTAVCPAVGAHHWGSEWGPGEWRTGLRYGMCNKLAVLHFVSKKSKIKYKLCMHIL